MLNSDLDILVGDTFYSEWWTLLIDGAPVDLSDGWAIKAQVRERADSPTVLYELGIQLGTSTLTIDDVATAVTTVRVHIPATASDVVGAFTGLWDLQVTHQTYDAGSLYRRTLVGGVVRARRDVTR